ncbi:SCO5555 family protein [Streptacidiphilus cavernicola]
MSPTLPPPPAPPSGEPGEPTEVELYALVAARLKEAHARVRALDVSAATRASLTRSLLLVTEAAKRDLPEAARRLAIFVDRLDGGDHPPSKAH